jgi:hypothetical protein
VRALQARHHALAPLYGVKWLFVQRRAIKGMTAETAAALDGSAPSAPDGMMAAVARARHGVLSPYLKAAHVAVASVNSPMQCMMKEICAQCLQVQRDPATGAETVVFSCFNQDQPLDRVDFRGLHERLGQNSLQEKLTKQWIDRCVRRLGQGAAAAAE